MDEQGINVVSLAVTDEGLEFLVHDPADERRGINVAHSYFVAFDTEEFGPQVADLLTEIKDVAETIHFGWKRAPRRKKDS